MFIIYSVIIGIAVGFIAGGNLLNLSHINLKWKSIALAAFLIQLSLFSDISFFKSLPVTIIVCLHVTTYLGLLFFVFANRKVPGIVLIGSGILLNFTAILLNGGHMPTTLKSVSSGELHNNVVGINTDTVLPWLGDIFHLSVRIPLANAFSIGDLIIAVGVCIYLIINMKSKKLPANKLRNN